MEYTDIGMCFVCGKRNERGLKLSFEFDREKKSIKTLFRPQEWQQGFGGIVHGGFLAILLDEVMVKLSYEVGIPAVTAEMNLRFKEPARIDRDIIVTGEIIRETKKIIYTKANAKYREGKIVAEAEGKLVKVANS
ncbi:PaaI family thioesterase [bacterium]|nr:PaaI family thioesterase [bacterium]